jgi:Family of unknown function (DUF5947)
MRLETNNPGRGSLAALQRFVRKPAHRAETCELCATALTPLHAHLLELDKHQVTCACDPCAILFDGNARQRYRRIPRDVVRLRDFAISDMEWDSLLIPINLAFFVRDSATGRTVAQYPSPGGAMESTLDLEYWQEIVDRTPIIARFEPDVEALLVNRIHDHREYFRAPIDHCFRLVGLIRKHWRGLSGGAEVWVEIDRFFHELSLMAGEKIRA